ncbi:hypothetical protein [Halorussus caseinilyticus]|uniref:Uncharacterized protein n=1 Tax=Halorussus caseinilyticus TaxID=3034025 RepID=A0ABD5WIC9_9EURY|nr:hypothetical protein [Halorussus sp. DT72]
MKRRQLLVVGATLLAGCSSGESGTDETETEQTTTTATTATPTRTTTATETTTETTTTEETTTETETEQTTTTEKPNEDIVAARKRLEEAFEVYTSVASSSDGEVSILDVTFTSGAFSRSKLVSRLEDARDALDDAAQSATDDEKKTIERLRDVALFFEHASYIERNLVRAYYHYGKVLKWTYAGDYAKAKSTFERMTEDRKKAADRRWTVDKETDVASTDATDLLTREEYDGTVKRLQNGVGDVKKLESFAEKLVGGFEKFADGNRKYGNGAYGDAASWFYRAGNDLEDLNDEISDAELVDALSSTVEKLTCLIEAVVEAAEHMEEAAESRENENTDAARRAERDARDAAESCDEVSKTLAIAEDMDK